MHILAVNWSRIVHSIASIVRQFSASNLSSFFPPQFGSILIFSLEQIDKKLRAHLVMLSLNKKSEKWKRQNSFLKDAISFHVNFLSSPKISFAICSGCNIYICWKKWSSLTVSLFSLLYICRRYSCNLDASGSCLGEMNFKENKYQKILKRALGFLCQWWFQKSLS